MLHAIAYLIFVFVFANWISFETGKQVSLRLHASWIVATVGAALLGSLLSLIVGGTVGNALLHAVGGGVGSTLLFTYILKTFGIQVVWRVEVAAIFAFVSVLGVLNELFEYVVELSGLGIMSLDSHDTWRDFVANSAGALITWLIIWMVSKQKIIKLKDF